MSDSDSEDGCSIQSMATTINSIIWELMRKFIIVLLAIASLCFACTKITIVDDSEIMTKRQLSQQDTTNVNDSTGVDIDIVIDTSLNVVEHTFTL